MHLRFSIRDLLWLTLVVALAVGWWAYSRASGRYRFVETEAGARIIDIKTGDVWQRDYFFRHNTECTFDPSSSH